MVTRRRRAEPNLDTYRRAIATIDRRIVLLLARRWATVRETMGFKRSRHLPLFDKAQEERVLARARGWAKELNLSVPAVDRLFRSIMKEGRRLTRQRDETPRPVALGLEPHRRPDQSRRKGPGNRA